ncbi:hypothetical protein RX327_02730 [Bradyrhizobium sp. BEA-2-5]|uniref:hypothetical protein n=1 Tax=Bradyrhizobium sp. BEA-2-5 TaxID=3080015 RepID=UPI00293E9FE9|nr:hypothetical protein [Bradyrhizobium sp. BEA-2-5]WOH82131.1 hypothetical protein RX327_02730 [Bradyrhizobium sp. BEA-2-5]
MPDEPREFQIKRIREVVNSEDGLSITMLIDWANVEGPQQWTISYKHAVWLADAILKVSPAAVSNQILSGSVQGATIPPQRLQVTDTQLLVKPGSDIAAISAVGNWLPDNAAGTTTLQIDRRVAEDLIEQLQAFLEATRQGLSRPS